MIGDFGDDSPEADELEAAAEWRRRKVDADPSDAASAAAAELLQALATELRAMPHSSLIGELRAICGWLGEFEGMEDFAQLAHAYRAEIGFSHIPKDAEAYLHALITLAKQTFGAP